MPDALIAQLTANQLRVQQAFRHDAAALAQSYAPGKWTARQLLLHIADLESLFLDRLRRALADHKPLLLALDPDRWTARLGGGFRDLALAEGLFNASRTAYTELASSITDEEWKRTAVHTEYGMFTVRQLVEKAMWHADHHLSQVEAAVAGRPWVKS
ncbi:MAG: DinB family protein [Planctomycetes bacterium]|nr:DinB family protein [Planctomycetota bacterium]